MHTGLHGCIGFSSASSSSADLAVRIHLPVDPANDAVRNVAVGSDAVFVVTASGRVISWGCSLHGRLGVDGMACMGEHDGSVCEVEGLGYAMQVVSGSEHCLALNADGSVFAWGLSVAGRLGIGAERAATLPCRAGHTPFTRVPERIEALRHKRIVGLACSDIHCLALAEDGSVFAWGSASMGRLGIGSDASQALTNAEASQPMPVTRLIGCPITQVVCSKANSAALSSTGEIFTWGATCYGIASCPLNSSAQEEPALLLSATPDGLRERFVCVTMGKFHALSLSTSGRVFSWGWAGDGALGLGPAADGNLCRAISSPTILTSLGAHAMRQIACGDSSSFAVTIDGRLAMWGTVPLPASALHVFAHSNEHSDHSVTPAHARAHAAVGDASAEVQRVLWPGFLRNQPQGHVSLPTMSSVTAALLLLVMLPPAEAQEQENSRANLQEQQQQVKSLQYQLASKLTT